MYTYISIYFDILNTVHVSTSYFLRYRWMDLHMSTSYSTPYMGSQFVCSPVRLFGIVAVRVH